MALKFELSVEDVAKLCKLGFTYRPADENNRESFLYEVGSIANWKRVIIEPAFAECSIANDEEILDCVYVTVEREKCAGYAETDWEQREHGKVPVCDLFNFLENEGISLETPKERIARIRQRHYENQALRAKLEDGGFDLKELEKLFR